MALLALALVYWLFLAGRLLHVLRERHPEVYDGLGRPSRLLLPTPGASARFLRFLLGGAYAELDDPAFVRLCGFLRLFAVLIAVGLVAAIWVSGGAP
jgi:hypothetical protein